MPAITSYTYIGLKGNGPIHVAAERMNKQQALTCLSKMQRGGMGHVLNATIRTRLPELNLHQLKIQPLPFYTIASNREISFPDFLGMISGFGNNLLKAWLVYERDGLVQHEISLGQTGLSLDGRLMSQMGLTQGLAAARDQAAPLIKATTYQLGNTAGALLLGEPCQRSAGIEIIPENTEVSFLDQRNEYDNYIKGVITISNFRAAVHDLLSRNNFLSVEIIQPALSVLVRRAKIYKTSVQGVFRLEWLVAEVRPEILQNLMKANC